MSAQCDIPINMSTNETVVCFSGSKGIQLYSVLTEDLLLIIPTKILIFLVSLAYGRRNLLKLNGEENLNLLFKDVK